MNRTETPSIRFCGFSNTWEQHKLGEFSEKVIEKNFQDLLSETFTNSAEYGVISQRDFFDHDISNAENICGYYIVRDDDFVYNPRISVTAPCGPINRNKLGRNGVMSPLYTVFRTHGVDAEYLEWFFKTYYWHNFMYFNGDSGTRSDRFSIKNDLFFQMPISIPSIEEQQKIGSALTKLENLITLHQRKYEKLKNLKASMLEKMFPKDGTDVPEVRFKGFMRPWQTISLKDIASEITRTDKTSQAPIMMITAANGFIDQSDRYSFDNAGQSLAKYIVLKKDELAYNHGASKLRPYGSCFALEVDEARIPYVYRCFAISDYNPYFVSRVLNNKTTEKQLRRLVTSGARMDGLLNISYEEYTTMKIQLPEKEEQDQISEYFKNIENLIILCQQELDKLQSLKKALLEKMFV